MHVTVKLISQVGNQSQPTGGHRCSTEVPPVTTAGPSKAFAVENF